MKRGPKARDLEADARAAVILLDAFKHGRIYPRPGIDRDWTKEELAALAAVIPTAELPERKGKS